MPPLPDPTSKDEAAEPVRRRYCGVCGAPWQAEWDRCPACAPAAAYPTGDLLPSVQPHALAPEAEKPRLTSAIALYFTLLAASLAGIIAGAAGASELTVDFFVSGAMTVITLAWCAAAAARPSLAMLFRPAPGKWFLVGAGAAVLTFGLAYAIVEGIVRGLGVERIDYTTPYLSGGYGLGMIVLMICVQPAVVEELAFRGVVFGALRPTLSTAEAVFVSAGMFMILHLSPGAFPHTFAMGVVAGFLRARTDSLLPGVLMHFVHNLLCVVVDYPPTG